MKIATPLSSVLRLLPVLLPALVTVPLFACGSTLTRSAERGDYAAVRAEVASSLKQGELEEADVQNAALATARRILETEQGPALATSMYALSPCIGQLESEFEAIADREDPIALTLLADSDRIGLGRLERYRDHKDARFRGLGARTLVGDDQAAARRKAFLDPAPEVRRGAMRAALAKPSSADEAELLDAARRDPDSYVRSTALRTLAILPSRSERLVGQLWDLWESADEAARETLASSFGLRPLYERGGRDVLRVILAQKKGPGVIAGALGAARTAKETDDVRDLSRSALVEHLRSGTQRERLFVLAATPSDWPAMEDAIRQASTDTDSAVAVRAWGRRAEKEAGAAKISLRAFAAREDRVGAEARELLAKLGDLSIQARLERDLASENALAKRAAVSALIALNRMPRAASALADRDLAFRAEASCMLLAR